MVGTAEDLGTQTAVMSVNRVLRVYTLAFLIPPAAGLPQVNKRKSVTEKLFDLKVIHCTFSVCLDKRNDDVTLVYLKTKCTCVFRYGLTHMKWT